MKSFLLVLLALSLEAAALGCGYKLVGAEQEFPYAVSSISIPAARNLTAEAGLEQVFTQELRRQFLSCGNISIKDEADAEASLECRVTEFKVSPATYSKAGKSGALQVSITADFSLVHKGSGEPLWSVKGLSESEEFPSSNDPLESERAGKIATQEAAEDLVETANEMLLARF